MCGIAGLVTRGRLDEQSVKRMVGPIAHRGPDDEGVWVDASAGIGLGNRRLAIIDLSPAGHQPMHSSNGRFVLTFNGEIYNHPELRAAVEERGGAPESGWRGHSDTETIIEAIATFGLEETLEKCVGMYAFALWDRQERRLALVRDRFGEKPLYYGWAGDDFVFGSELKALRGHPRFDAAIDRRSLSLFASRTYVPAPLSIYRGIFKLEPGCILRLTGTAARPSADVIPSEGYDTGGVSIRRYWSYRDVLQRGLGHPIEDEHEALDELERVLGGAVESQSITDVPVGAFLSGGIDSSTIVALYQKYSPQPVRTFTIGFEEQDYNEADYARAVARHFRTEHHERIVTPKETRDVIPGLPQIYDEPFADSSQIPTYLVSAFAREQVKVALSGDGGDELFGGYNRYFGTARLWSSLKRLPAPMRAMAGRSLGRVSPEMWHRLGALMARGEVPQYFGAKVRRSLRTVAGARSLDELVSSFLDEWRGEESPVVGASEALPCAFDLDVGRRAPDALRMMYCDAVSYLPDDILCKVDRASMSVSLETHAPYLDHRVAELAARLPMSMKIKGSSGKEILRKLLYREAPRELFERPKSGFSIPVGEWIKGPLRDWAEDLLDPRAMRTEGWFDPDAVARRWKEHLSGTSDSTPALWAILMFQAWQREQRVGTAAAA